VRQTRQPVEAIGSSFGASELTDIRDTTRRKRFVGQGCRRAPRDREPARLQTYRAGRRSEETGSHLLDEQDAYAAWFAARGLMSKIPRTISGASPSEGSSSKEQGSNRGAAVRAQCSLDEQTST